VRGLKGYAVHCPAAIVSCTLLRMGNQPVKGAKRTQQCQYPFNDEKKSRTDWTAGVPLSPGKPMVQLSSRTAPQDEDSVTDEINLTWTIPKDDGGFPITGYRIEMLDIQTNHWIEITFIEGFEPRCTLSNILYGIMYRFRAIAYNDAGPSEPGDPSDPVVIDVPGVQIAPYFVLMLNDTIALEHERVEFKVKVLGTPKPTIQWFKDDMEVFCSERLEIKEEDDGGTVIVKEVRMSDSGVIKCVATNILGRATSTGQLIVEAAPRLEIPEQYNEGLIFRFDEVIRLKVPLIAKPAPRITWFFDDEPICPSDDVTIETGETMTSLRIGAAKRWHCGEFRLLAQNENGEDSSSILVTVTAPPSPAGKPVVIDIAGTACTLRWEASQDDGGADVKHYIVEYFRDVWDVWLKAKTTKDCQVTIEDLIPGSRYKFRIKAENVYGISDESEESDPFDVAGAHNQEPRSAGSVEEGWTSPGSETAWSPDRAGSGGATSGAGAPGQQEAWQSPENRNKIPSLSVTKEEWASSESTEEALREGSEMLKDLLRVKKLTRRISSIESDGLPSMASVDVEEASLSESSDLQKARKMYADLTAMSMESAGSTEDIPDLDTAAKEFYNEIRALSIETGGSFENILENIGASSDSLASLIPYEKREELANFEMSLKQMIEEAKHLAASPSQDSLNLVGLAAGTPPLRSMENLANLLRHTPSYSDLSVGGGDNRSRKSISVVSQPESVVSVIEAPSPNFSQEIVMKTRRPSDLTAEEEAEVEPTPMSMRGRPIERTVRRQIPSVPAMPSLTKAEETEMLRQQDSTEDPEQAPPLESLEQVPPLQPQIQQQPVVQQPMRSASGTRRPGQVVNREPSVGSDRYEEIIVETRKRSLSRGPGSRVGSRMGSRASSQMPPDFRTSQTDFTGGGGVSHTPSIGKLDLTSLRNSTKSITALDLDTRAVEELQSRRRPMTATPPPQPQPAPSGGVEQDLVDRAPTPPTSRSQAKLSASPLMALDANQNATAATLPKVPTTKAASSALFAPLAKSKSSSRPPSKPDPIKALFPKNIPDWFVIIYTYSVVLILVLLVANSTPDGKLFIHFNALWCLIIYFILEEDQEDDILDEMVDKLIKS